MKDGRSRKPEASLVRRHYLQLHTTFSTGIQSKPDTMIHTRASTFIRAMCFYMTYLFILTLKAQRVLFRLPARNKNDTLIKLFS